MKIRVQGNHDLRMLPSAGEDGAVIGGGKADIAHVVGLTGRRASEAWWSAAGPGREAASAGNDRGKNFVVEGSGGESERLANVFVFEFGVLVLELGTVGVGGQGFEHTADR